MTKPICDAIQKDLGRGEFVTWFLEVSSAIMGIDHTLENLKTWMTPISVDTPVLVGPGKSSIVYEPLGTVLIIGSWNFPIFTCVGPLISAISSGNCAVLKPSEMAPNSAKIIQ